MLHTMKSVQKQYDAATRDIEPPFAIVDLTAFRSNAADLVRRANGKPIRVASKSVRCRHLIKELSPSPASPGSWPTPSPKPSGWRPAHPTAP